MSLLRLLREVFGSETDVGDGATRAAPERNEDRRGDSEPDDRRAMFLALIRHDDPMEIEGGRDMVSTSDVPILLALYWEAGSWVEKRNVIELTQDRCDEGLIEVAADFLRAPIAPGDDRGELAKAIALGHFGQEFDHRIDDDFDRYTDYSNDRALLRRKVDEALALLGVELESLPPASNRPAGPARPLTGPPSHRLLAAAALGDSEELHRALDDGADPNATVTDGDYVTCSALLRACMNRHYDLAKALVEAGADVNHRRTGPRPTEPAKGQTAMWWAAAHGRLDIIGYLEAAGGHLDTPDSWGSTPLHQAASAGHIDVARHLLARGADATARIDDGRTPLNLAATEGQTECVRLLLAHGVLPDITGSAGYTPLMLACEQGKLDMATALLDAGADVNAVHPGPGIYSRFHRWTPLVFAVAGGRLKITRLMIEAGADVNHEVVPPDDHRGEDLPARRVVEYCGGRQASRLRELLIEAGSAPPAYST